MTHIRTTIRNYVVARLTGTAAGARVYNSLVHPFQINQAYPIINVYTQNERADDTPLEVGPVSQYVTMTLVVEAIVKHNDTYAADLDSLCEQIENRIDYLLGRNAQSCLYAGTELLFNAEGEGTFAIARISYSVKYVFEEKGYPAIPDDLESIHVDWDMSDPNDGSVTGPDGQIDAQDIVDHLNV